MPSFYPNEGEILMQLFGLAGLPQKVGLFRNVVPQDGGVGFTNFQELPSGGGRAYATKSIDNAVNMSALVQNQWYITTNASGRAEAQYCAGLPPTAYMEWVFNATDVADGYSIYGAYRWVEVLPFDAGGLVNERQLQEGDIIKGGTSGATGEIAAMVLFSGSWAAGTAAGWLILKNVTGTWENDEDILISGEIGTINTVPTAGGTGYVTGDLVKIVETGGSEGLVLVVLAAAGVVSTVGLAHGGQGFTVAAGKATAKITGAGNDDLTVEVTALATSNVYAQSNTGTLFAGDLHKKVIVADLLTTAQAVSTSQPVQYIAKDQATTA